MPQQQAQHLTPGVPTGSGDGTSAFDMCMTIQSTAWMRESPSEGDVRSVSGAGVAVPEPAAGRPHDGALVGGEHPQSLSPTYGALSTAGPG